LARYDNGCWGRGFLKYDLLGLSSLANYDWGRWRAWSDIVFSFFLDSVNIVAMRILVSAFIFLLDANLVVVSAKARPAIEIHVALLGLPDGDTAWVCVFVEVLLVLIIGATAVIKMLRPGDKL
jgi:hypothetical protein